MRNMLSTIKRSVRNTFGSSVGQLCGLRRAWSAYPGLRFCIIGSMVWEEFHPIGKVQGGRVSRDESHRGVYPGTGRKGIDGRA